MVQQEHMKYKWCRHALLGAGNSNKTLEWRWWSWGGYVVVLEIVDQHLSEIIYRLIATAMNDYLELLSSYVAQNNELQVRGPKNSTIPDSQSSP